MIKDLVKRILNTPMVYLFVFGGILVSDDTFWFGTAGIQSLIYTKYVFNIVFPLILFIYFDRHLNQKRIGHLFAFIFAICVSSLVSSGISGGPLLLIFTIWAAILVASFSNRNTLYRTFVDVVLLLMIYSLIIWAGVEIGIFSVSYFSNSADIEVKTFGYCTFFSDRYGFLIRNGGIFREPGVFIFYICLAFLFDVKISNRLPINRILLYFISILSTLSTAGIIIFILLYGLYVVTGDHTNWSKIVAFSILGIAFVLFFKNETLVADVFEKISRGEESASTLGRLSSITIPWEIIKDHPLFGCGVDKFFNEYERQGEILYHQVIGKGLTTNTIMNVGAVYGAWFSIVMVIGLYKLSIKLESKVYGKILVFICFLMLFSNESMFYSIIVYVLLFLGFYNEQTMIPEKY